jgi:hypothetical protein
MNKIFVAVASVIITASAVQAAPAARHSAGVSAVEASKADQRSGAEVLGGFGASDRSTSVPEGADILGGFGPATNSGSHFSK